MGINVEKSSWNFNIYISYISLKFRDKFSSKQTTCDFTFALHYRQTMQPDAMQIFNYASYAVYYVHYIYIYVDYI